MQGDFKERRPTRGQEPVRSASATTPSKQLRTDSRARVSFRGKVASFAATHKAQVITGAIVLLIIVTTLLVWFGVHQKNNATTVSKNPAVIRYQEQLPELKDAVEDDPKSSDARKGYAVALYATGNLKQARSQYEEAIKLNDKDATAQNNLGNVYRDLEMADRAIAAYRRAVELNPKAINPYVNLANIQLYTQNDADAAIETYRSALKALPGNNQVELLLGIAFEQKKDTSSARQAYENILRRDSDNAAAKAGLERLNG